jgi:hypothetical protein
MRHLIWAIVFTTLQWGAQAALRQQTSLPTQVIYEFQNLTWIENLAIRSNGDLLLTILSAPELYSLTPAPSSTPSLLYTFPNAVGLVGIVETYPDTFILVTGNFSVTGSYTDSWTAWKVDFKSRTRDEGPEITKVADLPGAGVLNGVEVLPGNLDEVLIADSSLGKVWKLNVESGEFGTVIEVPEMSSPASATQTAVGINGLHIRDQYLYWTNSDAGTFYRIQIDSAGFAVLGAKAEIVFVSGAFEDDFTLDGRGTAWITTGPQNTVLGIGGATAGKGLLDASIGSIYSETMEGSTACKFGRGAADRETLFVVTNGGLEKAINGTVITGGKVVAVDTRGSGL